MITTLFTINRCNLEHLASVRALMRGIGSPTIRVVDCGDYYQAIEGSHRIQAAADLGIAIDLDVLAQDDLVESDSLDIDYFLSGQQYTAGEIAGEVHSGNAGIYQILRGKPRPSGRGCRTRTP